MPESNIPQANLADQVNVFNPEGDLVSIPSAQAQQAQSMGYRTASPEDVHEYKLQEEHGGGLETAKAFAEGAGRAATFGLSTGLERAAGVKPEDIEARKEANPIASTAGELTGLAGSAIVPFGEGALLGRAGEAASEALGLGGANALSKIGSHAVKSAVDTALFQSGDEVSKMLASDPNQTVGTAMADIGLSGLMGAGLGGAFGAVSPLWTATTGEKLGGFLENIQKRANGEAIELPKELASALGKADLNLPAEIRTAIAGDPQLSRQYDILLESQTTPGIKAQESLQNFRKHLADETALSTGASDILGSHKEYSPFEVGSQIKDTIAKSVEKEFKPISDSFNKIRDRFSKVPLSQADDTIADKLVQLSQDEGWHLSEASPQNKLVQNVLKDLPNLNTLEDLRKYQSNVWAQIDTLNPQMKFAAGKVSGILRDAEDLVLDRHAAGSEMSDIIKNSRGAYKNYIKSVIEPLNDRLNLGKFRGPESFVDALKDMRPEDILRKLTKSNNDAGLLPFLKDFFPSVADTVKEHELNRIIGKAAARAPEGFPINAKVLHGEIDKLTPEMKSFVFGENSKRLDALRTIEDALPKHKSSYTARHLDNLWSKVPAGAMGMASLLAGHNPGIGFMVGSAGKWLMRDAPDAIRLGLLKFLGHSGPVNPSAFKAMVDYASAIARGEARINKGVGRLFKAGVPISTHTRTLSEPEKKRLDKKLQLASQDNSQLLNSGGNTAYYLPDHGQHLSETAMRAVTYLNSIKTHDQKPGMLDQTIKPSQIEQAKYDRALNIVNSPINILNHIKSGTIVPEDVVALKSVHPGLYDRLSQKIISQIVDVQSKGSDVPYNIRMGLSMFLMQPVDSSFSPQSILSNQATFNVQASQPIQSKGPHNYKELSKMPNLAMTQGQSREAERMKG